MRRTKIILTLGPSTFDRDILVKVAKEGMDIARVNMSHNTLTWHSQMIDRVRDVASELSRKIDVEVDVQGPSVRTGDILSGADEQGFLPLSRGQNLTLSIDDNAFAGKIFVNHPELIDMVDIGSKIFIDDAFVQLKVLKKDRSDIHCVSINDSKLGSKRTIHIPGKSFILPVLREKDWKDLEFAIKKDAEYIGISFVRSDKELKEVRDFIKSRGSEMKIISKIETPEALENINSIIKASDMVMVARGDMGVVLPLETVPTHQYNIIKKCKEAGKPVITATEMLHSMKNQPLPTRAEVNDVFTAVVSGSDGVCLSGETSEGNYPLEAAQFMRRIVDAAESSPHNFSY
jgi:pyruvate kinase